MIGKDIIYWLEENWNLDKVCKDKDDLKYKRTTRFDYEYFKNNFIEYINKEINKLQQPEVDKKNIVNNLKINHYYKNIIDGDIILIMDRYDDDISQYEYVSITHGYCMDLVETFEDKYIEHTPNDNIIKTLNKYKS